MWFSFPVYGQDRFHRAAVGYLVTTGKIVPETVTYYANFPQAHVFAAVSTLITGVPLKTGYFSLGIAVSISIIGVYLIGRYILQNGQGALLAAFFVAIGSYHIRSGSEPFAQALFTALAPIIIYFLFLRDRSVKQTAVVIGLAIFAATVQNIAPLVLVGVCLLFGLGEYLNKFVKKYTAIQQYYNISISSTIVAITAISGVFYYVIADYFRFQTMRVFGILESLLQSESESEAIGEALGDGIPTVSIFGNELPGLLMWAIPILVISSVLILVGYTIVFRYIQGKRSFGPLQYIIMSGCLFGIFGLIFVVRSGGVTRSLPYIIIIISPVFGWLALNLTRDKNHVGSFIIVLLAVSVSFAGILTPIVAKPALSDDEFQPYLESNQVTAVEFASEHTSDTMSSSYVDGHERVWRVTQGYAPPETVVQGRGYNASKSITVTSSGPDLVIRGVLNDANTETIQEYKVQSQAGETTMYFEYYRKAYNINPPRTSHVYSSGSTHIYW
jgi:hypothetical protein